MIGPFPLMEKAERELIALCRILAEKSEEIASWDGESENISHILSELEIVRNSALQIPEVVERIAWKRSQAHARPRKKRVHWPLWMRQNHQN
jgi:hypothetical protein